MSALDTLFATARTKSARIVLPEGSDPRIIEGAVRARAEGIAQPILLGDPEMVSAVAEGGGYDLSDLQIINPASPEKVEAYADVLLEARKGKLANRDAALKLLKEPLALAAIMVRAGDAEGTLGGAVYTTADTVRTALQMIGRADGVSTVSSFFLMVLPEGRSGGEEAVIFSDCGLVVDPTPEQLVDIAAASAASFAAMTGRDAKIGFLSFSTKGSARHAMVTKVSEAALVFAAQHPAIPSDGELQFDAAFVPSVGASKAAGSATAGEVNVFIFPNLDAGNIGYKIAQRIGGAQALGPVLQGLAKPANDLSRGCNADDVYKMIAVTAAQV